MKIENISDDAEKIVRSLVDAGIKPDAKFIAAAGKDYGFVFAWKYGNDNMYVIECGDNTSSCYKFIDTNGITDMASLLECDSNDLDVADIIFQTANVRGPEAVPSANKDDEGPFCILITKNFGTSRISDLLRDEDGFIERLFDTYDDAKKYIKKIKNDAYSLARREVERPSYKIVAIGSDFTSRYSSSIFSTC